MFLLLLAVGHGRCKFLVISFLFNFSGPHRIWASPMAQGNLPAMQETRVQFLGQEDPLEKEIAIHSSILAWRISWTEEPGRLQCMGLHESDST